jgi:hypothetical protein
MEIKLINTSSLNINPQNSWIPYTSESKQAAVATPIGRLGMDIGMD